MVRRAERKQAGTKTVFVEVQWELIAVSSHGNSAYKESNDEC